MSFIEIVKNAGSIVSAIVTFLTFLALLVKPIRQKILGNKIQDDGIKCLLRDSILETYYKYRRDKEIPRSKYESCAYMYAAYKNMKGNSFIDRVWAIIKNEWEIVEEEWRG